MTGAWVQVVVQKVMYCRELKICLALLLMTACMATIWITTSMAAEAMIGCMDMKGLIRLRVVQAMTRYSGAEEMTGLQVATITTR